jgi:hypothetical protein
MLRSAAYGKLEEVIDGIWGDTSRFGLVALLGCCVATSSEKDSVERWSTEHEIREKRHQLKYG